jgi:hypothetical protein
MSTGRYIGRVGALAVTLGVGFAAITVPGVAVAEPSDSPSSDTTALLVCGTACPTWHESDVEIIMNQVITPTHPGQTITPVAVTTPSEQWPITGLLRLIGVAFGIRASSDLAAQCGRMSRGGNCRGCSTSSPMSRCRPGWPI